MCGELCCTLSMTTYTNGYQMCTRQYNSGIYVFVAHTIATY